MVFFTLVFVRPVSFAGPLAHRERRSRKMSRISRQQRMLGEPVSGHVFDASQQANIMLVKQRPWSLMP